MKAKFGGLIFCLVFLYACNKQLVPVFVVGDEVEWLEENPNEKGLSGKTSSRLACQDFEAYAPDSARLDEFPMRYVRVNVHIITDSLEKHNFNEKEGRLFAKELVKHANWRLEKNKQMHLPKGNSTPALPTRFRYVLTGLEDDPNDTGVYFHKDNELFFFNKRDRNSKSRQSIFSSAHYKRYGTRQEEVVNVFVLAHPPDSIGSKTYPATADGAGMSRWAKIGGAYFHMMDRHRKHPNRVDNTANFFSGLFNHEIGHSLGLRHSWMSDGCPDTPNHPNCWNYTPSGPCKENVSNNVMDYNAFQNAYSPCQLGKVHYNFARKGSPQRKILQPDWCVYEEAASINITEETVWNHTIDVKGDIIIRKGASLTILCTLGMPKGGSIFVEPEGKLHLAGGTIMNRCEEEWEGIVVYKKGGEMTGEVQVSGRGKIHYAKHKITKTEVSTSVPENDK